MNSQQKNQGQIRKKSRFGIEAELSIDENFPDTQSPQKKTQLLALEEIDEIESNISETSLDLAPQGSIQQKKITPAQFKINAEKIDSIKPDGTNGGQQQSLYAQRMKQIFMKSRERENDSSESNEEIFSVEKNPKGIDEKIRESANERQSVDLSKEESKNP